MTSPPSSSSESSSSKATSSLSSFDPFAVHSFTNCSVNQSTGTPVQPPGHHGYAYPYGPSTANYNTPYGQFPQSSTNRLPSSSTPRSPPKPYGYSSHTAGIFVPFRKETASPELGDVLKATKTKASNSFSSSNLPKPASQPLPISHTRKH